MAYVVDGRKQEPDETGLQHWRRTLALRGDSSFLAVILPGRLDIYELGLDNKSSDKFRKEQIEESDQRASLTFPRLHLTPSTPPQGKQPFTKPYSNR